MPITALSDAELLAQARGGDEAAFTELYVRHQAAARGSPTLPAGGRPRRPRQRRVRTGLRRCKRGARPDRVVPRLPVRDAAAAGGRPASPDRATSRRRVPRADRAEAADAGADAGRADAHRRAPTSRCPTAGRRCCGTRRSRGSHRASSRPRWACRPTPRPRWPTGPARSCARPTCRPTCRPRPRPECEPHRSRLGAYVRGGLSPRDRRPSEAPRRVRVVPGAGRRARRRQPLAGAAVLPLFLLVGGGTLGGALVGGAAAGAAAGKSIGTGLFGKIRTRRRPSAAPRRSPRWSPA